MNKSASIIVAAAAVSVISGTLLLSGGLWSTNATDSPVNHGNAGLHMPIDVLSEFGDREKRFDALGPNYVYIDESFVDSDNNCDFCYGIKYDGGPHEMAFVSFRSKEPIDLTRASVLLFDARGEQGGEVITVYAIGDKVQNSTQLDGLEFAFEKEITLDREWKVYQVDIAEFERSSVTHGFAFLVRKSFDNATEIVYFDNVYYDVEKQDHAITLT